MLFEVAILELPTKEEREEGTLEKLVFGPMSIIARDEQAAGIAAVLQCKDDIKVNTDRMQVLIRPFA